jgi:hypothetical protein
VLAHKQRRSQRVILDVPLLVRGEDEHKHKHAFQEDAMALIVNAHGALVILEASVTVGQKVIVTNVKSGEEREGTVAFVSSAYAGLAKVGIQFDKPAPEFWSLRSPPTDWSPS